MKCGWKDQRPASFDKYILDSFTSFSFDIVAMIKSIYMIYALFLALLLTVVIATDLSNHFVTFPGARTVGGCCNVATS